MSKTTASGRNRPFSFLSLRVIAVVALALAACSRPAPLTQADPFRVEFALDTICVVFLYDQANDEVYDAIFARIHEIERRMSAYLPDSDISRINAAAGIAPVRVYEDVFDVIERAVHFAEISGGAFDPAIGPLVSLWAIMADDPRVPSPEEIAAVLPLVNWRDIELDRQQRAVFLRRPGMALNLGAIAKGYAADEAMAIVREARLERALVDLGGDVMTFGVKLDRTPWRIGIQNPLGERGDFIGVLSGWDMAVLTSGVNERFFERDGVRYHHLFSPFDGHPARTGLLSVTIISGSATDGDALSTAVFVLGYERGRALIESIEGAGAIFVFEDRSVRVTGGVDFVLVDPEFRLAAD
ncbi:MAG: FAD:protein FMN transferase [Treponema sp.]|nr:FAD:protein FMN transferase [Treponema sp.]